MTAIYLGWEGASESLQVLEAVEAQYDVVFARHCAWGDAVDQDELARLGSDYLFSFGPTLLRRALLDSVRVAAINFHTAPPRWPGRGSVSFALFHGDDSFGVTAHLMTEAIDQGPILRVLSFPIRADDTVQSLDERTKAAIPVLAELVLADLAADPTPAPSGEAWEQPTRRLSEMQELMRIEPEDDDDAVRRKVRAFSHPTKPGPYLERGGFEFWHLGGRERH